MLALNAKGFSIFDKIHIARHLASSKAFVELYCLQLANHAQTTIVEDDGNDGNIIAGNGKELGAGHLKAAITAQADGTTLGSSQLCTHGCRQAKAHGAQATASDELARKFNLQMLCCPHLVLAYIRSNDVILTLNNGVQRFKEARCLFITKIIIHAGPSSDFIPPSG